MPRKSLIFASLLTLLAATATAFAANAPQPDGDAWTVPADAPSWARNADGFKVSVESADVLGAKNPTIKVEHSAWTDWAVRLPQRIAVEFGQIIELTARVRVDGSGTATTGVVLYSGNDAISWVYGGRTVAASEEIQTVSSKFVVPRGVDQIEPRMIGDGPATVWFADYEIRRLGTFPGATASGESARKIVRENATLKIEAETINGSFSILDKRTGRLWKPIVAAGALFVQRFEETPNGFAFDLLDGRTFGEFRATVLLEKDAPEAVVEISAPADSELNDSIAYPYAFATKADERIVLPVNEGISFPTTEPEPGVDWLHTYGGHGLCMAFWAVVDDKFVPGKGCVGGGLAGIVETPDDAAIFMKPRRSDETPERETLSIESQWIGQKRKFGYNRKLRLISFESGGHVAVCKRYRRYADEIGLLVSFDEKERRNPNLREGFDRLIGSANIWCWDANRLGIIKMLKDNGFDRILWSAGGSAEDLAAMNELDGVLTSRYDIYQDAMNPERFPELQWIHGDWTSDAWPDDLCWDSADGRWTRGWEVEAKDPTKPRIPCGVLCDAKALPYAEKRISKELETKPYKARFLDTTVASSWRECWNPAHPMTRTESKDWRMKLLALMGERFDLVCGSETGHEASVPYCDFYEGMSSLGPYRCPESGRDMARIWTEVPENMRKYQVGEKFRLPLFELVYHECVVSYWYWGDYNNKFPAIWKKRDLINALYGTPPMYMFTQKLFEENRERFAESYRIATSSARLTGRSEMTDHQILTPDRSVQKTVFACGVEVYVNFGDKEFKCEDGEIVAPESSRVVVLPQ